MIKHYLLTNLDNFDVDTFLKYCWGSIKRQGNKDFTWLVGINYQIPSYLWEDWAECQQFQNVMLSPSDNFVEMAQKWINQDLLESSNNEKITHVLTTHVRWDQGLSHDFVKTIQGEIKRRRIRPGTGMVINPSLGIYINQFSKIARQESLVSGLSPFVSLLEPIDEVMTVMWYDRQELKEPFPIINIRDRPLWVRVIDRHNLVGESQMNSGKFQIDPRMFRFLPTKYLNQVVNRNIKSPSKNKSDLKTRRKTIYNVHGRHVVG